jgi:hypothetical protein
MIFDYISVPETTSLPPVDFLGIIGRTVMPLWRERGLVIDSSLGPSSISRPFFCSHSIRFSIRGGDDIYGVTIDYPYNEGPTEPLVQVVKLLEKLHLFTPPPEYYGYNKAIILAGRVGNCFNYSWPDEQNDDPLLVSLHTKGSF